MGPGSRRESRGKQENRQTRGKRSSVRTLIRNSGTAGEMVQVDALSPFTRLAESD